MHTSTLPPPAIRAALQIHDQLSGAGPRWDQFALPEQAWEDLRRITRLLPQIASRGWTVAEASLLEDLDYGARRLERDMHDLRQHLPVRPAASPLSSAGNILGDLIALESEFDEVVIDLQQRTVAVLTEPIELEGQVLGAFRVVLQWDLIGQSRDYQVVAVRPCPAAGNEEVTHPHVRDEALCEGHGAVSIRAALAQGRLLDFFTLVSQILQTYNPDSAHVLLDRWDGVSCRDCGWRMPRDEYGTCDRCEAPVCTDCSTHCQGCDRFVCSGCVGECSGCGDYFCTHCLNTPANSSADVCHSCLEKRNEDQTNEYEENISADPSPAMQPVGDFPAVDACPPSDAVCLGETVVHT